LKTCDDCTEQAGISLIWNLGTSIIDPYPKIEETNVSFFLLEEKILSLVLTFSLIIPQMKNMKNWIFVLIFQATLICFSICWKKSTSKENEKHMGLNSLSHQYESVLLNFMIHSFYLLWQNILKIYIYTYIMEDNKQLYSYG